MLLHCVEAQSRTPTVAALYGARLRNISSDQALRDISAALPDAHPNSAFRAALRRIEIERPQPLSGLNSSDGPGQQGENQI